MSNILTAALPEELRNLDLNIKPVLSWTYVTKQDLSITNKSTGSVLENDKLPELHKASPISPYYDNLSIKSLIPSQLAAFYGFNRIANQGQGQTIYIINAYGNPNYQADLNKFCTQFNLLSTVVPNYFVGGVPNWNTVAPADSARWLSWAYETNLNIQYAHAMAPLATKVLITCLDENWLFDGISAAMTQLSAKIFSCSWGATESPTFTAQFSAINDIVFKNKPALFCVSSGNTSGVVSYPSSSPDVISVGGSQLNGGSASNYWVSAGPIRETTWLYAGSGPSITFPQPSYQTNFTPATSGRFTPDVSYNAGAPVPVYITQPTLSGVAGWGYFMGTSAAAPQIAAFIARLYSAGLLSTVNSRIIQQTLYSLASSSQSYYFNDITTGNNVLYSASAGYDSATGLGSPAVANIINLVGGPTPTPTQTRTSTPTPTRTRTSTPTPTRTPTRTRNSLISTPTPTPSLSGVFLTPTPTVTRTRSLSSIVTPTPTKTTTSTPTVTVTRTLSSVFNVTPTPTVTVTRTATPTPTVTVTRTLSGIPSVTPTPSSTRTPSLSGLTTSLSVRLGDGTSTATLNFVNGLLVSIV